MHKVYSHSVAFTAVAAAHKQLRLLNYIFMLNLMWQLRTKTNGSNYIGEADYIRIAATHRPNESGVRDTRHNNT